MTYEAEVQFKFDATYTHDYNRGFASHLGEWVDSADGVA